MELLKNGTDAQKEAITKGIVSPLPKYFNFDDSPSFGCSTGGANTMRYSYVGIEWGRALMGADIVSGSDLEANDLAGKKFYRYDHVNILPAANMGYADEYKGDGKGGWLDDGRADMRFFLINHVGTGGGEFGGMAVDTEKFPGEVRFNDVKFPLEDPRDHGGKAIVSFGSDKAPSIRLRETGELPVGKTAELLLPGLEPRRLGPGTETFDWRS